MDTFEIHKCINGAGYDDTQRWMGLGINPQGCTALCDHAEVKEELFFPLL